MALGPNDIRLNNVRLAFPKLDQPEAFQGGTDPTKYFSATLILPKNHPQLKDLEKLMVSLANAKWGAKGAAILKGAKAIGKVFLRDGDTKAEYDGFEGNMFVSARTKVRPALFDGQRNPVAWEDGLIRGGDYVNATISCFAYGKGNNGLGAELKGVQFRSKGDAFGAGGKPSEADDFEELSVAEDDINS